MTSRQPGTEPPGTTGHVDGDHGDAALTAQDWLLRLLPLTLLIIAGLAGLRGAVGALRWDGPLHADALVVGVVLEVVIVTMLVILLIRRRSGSQEATAVKLRGVLLSALGAGAVAAAVVMVAGLHLHLFSQRARPRHFRIPVATPSGSIRPRPGAGPAPHISLTVLLYALLVVLLLAGIAVCIWLARRLRTPAARRGAGVGPVGAAHRRRRAGRHHRVLPGHGDSPGRTRRGPGRGRHPR